MTITATEVRDPSTVPTHLVPNQKSVADLAADINAAVRVAVDTETWGFGAHFEGHLRVLIAALRRTDGSEAVYVVDVRDVDRTELAQALSGAPADGWNANFDARVTDRDLFDPAGLPGIRWYDDMFADAVLFQGASGFKFYHGLAWASERYLGIKMSGKGTTQTSFDESTDLSDEQVRYAAADGVITLWVGDVLRDLIAEAGLERTLELELCARPFLDHMERYGMPIDFDGWLVHLAGVEEKQAQLLDRLSDLTGGGQLDIFTGVQTPAWNPGSADQLKDQLNRFDTERVRAYFATRDGGPRLFIRSDTVDKDTLRELGGEIATTVLSFRDTEKDLKTYGKNLQVHIREDGRIHPLYRQIIGTVTGRLASSKPNAQNFTPKLKPYFRPADPRRVIVYADLSQAELRFLSEVSADEALREAFRAGVDIHEATASRMFGVDMAALKVSDPAAYKANRAKGKILNFGIVYGLGAAALGRNLTLSGVETSTEDAKGLLDAYLRAYPGVAAWLGARDQTVRALVDNPPVLDLDATLRLQQLRKVTSSVSSVLKDRLGRRPDAAEIASEVATDGIDADAVRWALSFEAPVVLTAAGVPFEFPSYTEAGRRRRFQVSTEAWVLSVVMTAVTKRHPLTDGIRERFAATHGVVLANGNRPLRRNDLEKVFEDRQLRTAYFTVVREALSPEAFDRLARTALADQIGAMGNAYRNAPIQGGVADVALEAYGRLVPVIGRYRDVWPVQTVHDSISLECWAEDAVDLAVELRATMEDALSSFCPSVPAVADADIRTSLDDGSVVVEIGPSSDLDVARSAVREAVEALASGMASDVA